MTNKLIIFLYFTLSTTCSFAQKTIKVNINPNLETFTIVERFAYPNSNIFKFRDSLLKIQPIIRPMVKYAYEFFKNKNHSNVSKHMSALVDTIIASKIGGQDAIFYALLHTNDFPKKGYKTKPYDITTSNPNLTKATRDFLNNETLKLIEELRLFYIDEKVELFMEKYKFFYNGAINEVVINVPPNIIQYMEDYYRVKDSNSYTIYLMPTRPFSKGEWQANGHNIEYENGEKETIQILSSSYIEVPFVQNSKYTSFGFNDKDWLQELTIHEFGHTFCKFSNENNLEAEKSNYLFSDLWQETTKNQGYLAWRYVVNEHIVRTGEIRIAEKMGDTLRANKLRKNYIFNKKFIFIPQLEKEMIRYENTPLKYTTFQLFMPELIDSLKIITTQERDKLWSDSGQN
jgi:hypothetical protein